MNSSDAWNMFQPKYRDLGCFLLLFNPFWLFFVIGFSLASTRILLLQFFEVTFFKVLFFSTDIPVFLTAVSRRRMHFICPKQNASCWLRMASGAFAVTFVLPTDKIFCFLFNLNIPPPILFISLPNWKVLYFQRSSFKTDDFIGVTAVPRRSFDSLPGRTEQTRQSPCKAFPNALTSVSLSC